jgi:hypothetical protein
MVAKKELHLVILKFMRGNQLVLHPSTFSSLADYSWHPFRAENKEKKK